jgi:hypothetical protein
MKIDSDPASQRASREDLRVASRPGDVLPGGAVVDEVIQISNTCGVYITKGDKLHWLVDSDGDDSSLELGRSSATAMDLLTQLHALRLPKSTHRRGLKIIGTSLHEALTSRTGRDRRNHFSRAQEFVTTRLRERLQIWYFATAGATTLLLAALLGVTWGLVDEAGTWAMAGLLGGVGAFLSVAQRFRSIRIERYTSYSYTALGGISRIVFGVIFGGLLLLMQKAGLVLAIADTQPFLLAVACFIAGFSERLIPELLEQLESRLAEPQPEGSGPAGSTRRRPQSQRSAGA